MTIIPRTASVAATAAAALLALSFSAEAFPVSQQTSNVHGSNGAVTMKLSQGISGNVSAGAFALKGDLDGDSVVDSFVAWCVDIQHALKLTSNYEIGTLPFSASVTASLQALVNTAYAAVEANLTDKATSAGFQLALWEIITETKPTYDVTSGTFKASTVSGSQSDGNAARAKANQFLAGLGGPVTGEYTLTYLASTSNPAGQGLVTIAPTPPVSEVPVPAAGLMLLGALGGLGAIARRRKSTQA